MVIFVVVNLSCFAMEALVELGLLLRNVGSLPEKTDRSLWERSEYFLLFLGSQVTA